MIRLRFFFISISEEVGVDELMATLGGD